MDLIFLLCLCAATSAYAESQNPSELDRARSAWNFGGHQPRRKLSDNGNYWMSRTRNVPGGVIADRRSSPAFNVYKTPSPMAQPIQYLKHTLKPKPYSNPKHKGVKAKKAKKGNKKRRPSKTIGAKIPKHPQMVHDYFNPRRTMRFPATKPKPGGSFRLPRKINRRSDSIMERFNMDDLWHLDKGESYALKNEDIYRDQYIRGVLPEGDDEENEIHDHDDHHDDHHQKLQDDAEDLINHKERNCEHFKNAENGDDKMPHHVHHHHHYQQKNATNSTKAEETKPAKKPDKNKIVPYTLPRIHNPIPLGCLLAVPVFHPIRPRHQLTCLLSIPGTPNLIRKRRSADLQQQQPAQSLGGPAVGTIQPQYSTFPMNTYNLNERMSPPSLRKHYANHVGGEKTPAHPQPPSRVGNLKVPATIIAPPKFDKADVLQMLLGSGAVNLDEMGTILMTNNRYVRIGRGLPNSSPENTRGGRSLWGPIFPSRGQPMSSSATQTGKQQSAQFSNNNLIPTTQGKPSHKENGRMPLVALTPIPPSRMSSAPSSNSQGLMQNIIPTRRQPPAQHSIASFSFQQSSAAHPSQHAPFVQPPLSSSMLSSPVLPQQTFDVPLPLAQGSLAQQVPQQSTSFTQEGTQGSGKPSKIDKVMYADWKPFSNQKPKISRKPAKVEFSDSPLGAESKLVIKKVKAPSSVSQLSSVSPPEEIVVSKLTSKSEYIDVSDLAEALGYIMPLELESITSNDYNVEQTLQSIETPDTDYFDSMSYAVKNEFTSSVDDEDENALRYSLHVEDDYDDGEASTIRYISARKGKRIPDPIIIQVPK